MINLKLVFHTVKGRCHGNQFLLDLSTEPGTAGRRRLVAQPGRLTLRFTVHLVFTARCYASAVLAMGLCLCLSVSVCHKSEFYLNG